MEKDRPLPFYVDRVKDGGEWAVFELVHPPDDESSGRQQVSDIFSTPQEAERVLTQIRSKWKGAGAANPAERDPA